MNKNLIRSLTTLIIMFISLISFGQNEGISELELIGCWTDSREENIENSNFRVFRPCDYKSFPTSRFRFIMELKEGNNCSWLYLAPNDGHHMKSGTWTFNYETMTLKILNTEKKVVKVFVITGIEENLLRINN